MDSVNRYDPVIISVGDDLSPVMEESYTGDYVKYEDWEELADKLLDLRCELETLKSKITDLWREI